MTKKILIVDDEQLFLDGLSKALRKFCDFYGKVKTVEKGKDAIEEISRCFYDICFLDINLPDLNGLEVMKKINELSPQTKIAIMTARPITDDIRRAIDERASLFIDKPINLDRIKAFLKQTLREGVEVLERERRRFERKTSMKTVNYSISVFDPDEELKADIIDISSGGVGFSTDYPLECGHVLWVKEGMKQKAGIVRWSMMLEDNYRVGIQFI